MLWYKCCMSGLPQTFLISFWSDKNMVPMSNSCFWLAEIHFSKAFDKVPHRRLLHKLRYYGIRNNTFLWIQDFLSHRTQEVQLEGHKSTTADVLSGVLQGTVLGPLLFLLFINDLPESTESDARLFADDCLLFRPIRNNRDTQILQNDLNSMEEWENRWQMAFHPEKCVVIRVSNKRKPINARYTIHGHMLQEVDSSKYLGVTISKDLRWDDHINTITAKANRTLGFLRRNMRGCKSSARAAAYQGLVRPTLEYACSTWDPWNSGNIQQVEKVQRRAARFVTRNYHDRHPGSVTQMVQQLQWETLQVRRVKIRLVLLYKIQQGLVAIPAHLLSAWWYQNQRRAQVSSPKREERHLQIFILPTNHWWLEQTTCTRRLCHLTRRFQEPAGHTHRVPAGSPDNVNIQQSRFYFNCTLHSINFWSCPQHAPEYNALWRVISVPGRRRRRNKNTRNSNRLNTRLFRFVAHLENKHLTFKKMLRNQKGSCNHKSQIEEEQTM